MNIVKLAGDLLAAAACLFVGAVLAAIPLYLAGLAAWRLGRGGSCGAGGSICLASRHPWGRCATGTSWRSRS